MKKVFVIAVFLSSLISCNVPENCRISKTFSGDRNISLTGRSTLKLDFLLKYNSTEAKNKPSLELGFKKDEVCISFLIQSHTRVKASRLRKITKNAFLQLELYKLPIEDQLRIKNELRDFRKKISDSKSKAKKLIKSNKKIKRLNI